MYALKVLHKKLKQACPFIHQKRLTIFMLATHVLLIGQRLSFTQLGRHLKSKARVKHNIKKEVLGTQDLITQNYLQGPRTFYFFYIFPFFTNVAYCFLASEP